MFVRGVIGASPVIRDIPHDLARAFVDVCSWCLPGHRGFRARTFAGTICHDLSGKCFSGPSGSAADFFGKHFPAAIAEKFWKNFVPRGVIEKTRTKFREDCPGHNGINGVRGNIRGI